MSGTVALDCPSGLANLLLELQPKKSGRLISGGLF